MNEKVKCPDVSQENPASFNIESVSIKGKDQKAHFPQVKTMTILTQFGF